MRDHRRAFDEGEEEEDDTRNLVSDGGASDSHQTGIQPSCGEEIRRNLTRRRRRPIRRYNHRPCHNTSLRQC